MDPATQGFLGACAVQSAIKDTGREKLWLVALLAGMAADLDVFIRSPSNPLLFIYYHRHFTHALLFIPIGGLLVAAFLLAFKPFRVSPKKVVFAAIIAYGTHGILDACTSYGTLLYWPFSHERVAFDIISIIDPLFTAPLFIGSVLSAITEKQTWARLGLLLSLLYLSFAALQHHRAMEQQSLLAETRHQTPSKARVTPTLANVFYWRSIYIDKNKIYLDSVVTPFNANARSQAGVSAPHFTAADLPTSISSHPILRHDFEIFNWFADGFISQFQQTPLVVADMRYLFRRQYPLRSLWGIEFPSGPKRQHVYWRRMVDEKR